MARRRNPSRRNPSKAVYIATGVVAAAAVLYLMVKKDETAVSTDTSTDTSTVDLTTGRSGVRGGTFTPKVQGTTPAEKLAYAKEHPKKYDENGTVVVITKREARQLVNSGEYRWNVVQTAVIHNSRA